uniref:MFS domain-containing protein n=2 Tax=Caenorhabditis japonica TaxID=281687 RepID=A0A8R1E0R6_CAEJA
MNSQFEKPSQKQLHKHEVEHIPANGTFVTDVSVVPSITTGSDHRLLRGNLRFNINLASTASQCSRNSKIKQSLSHPITPPKVFREQLSRTPQMPCLARESELNSLVPSFAGSEGRKKKKSNKKYPKTWKTPDRDMSYLLDLISSYRNNRKILLLIVYIALFLDNMLLTTVVPIIPEYLLRMEHPNETDIMFGTHSESRVKRQWVDDDSWDVPLKLGKDTDINWEENPIGPNSRAENRRKESRRKNQKNRNKDYDDRRKLMSPAANKPSHRKTEEPRRQLDENERHKLLASENVHVGLMFGSKALVQLLVNPWIGPLTNKIGYTLPMFGGFIIMFSSTILFAFGDSYLSLWLARALQGVGSACTSTSGMGMLAQAYPDDLERGSAMGIALGGLALGVLVGPPYGGLLYQWSGKELPFVLLALLALFDGTLQFMVLQPKIDRGEPEGSTIKQLAKDPYIIVAAGAITVGNLGIAMLEPSLPLWMMESWGASSLERGAAFLPASISYLVGTNIFGPLAHRMGRWLSSFIGLVIIGFSLLSIPSATSVTGLIIPHGLLGFSIGMIDASMFPLMGYLVDIRHVGVYGSIYAIADAAFCFAFALGPFFSGPLVKGLGFPTMMYIIAIISFLYAPLMFLLKNPPVLIDSSVQSRPVELQSNGNQIASNENYERIEGTNIAGQIQQNNMYSSTTAF